MDSQPRTTSMDIVERQSTDIELQHSQTPPMDNVQNQSTNMDIVPIVSSTPEPSPSAEEADRAVVGLHPSSQPSPLARANPSGKKRRGITTCTKVTNRRKANADPLPIEFDQYGNAIGPNADLFKTYLGTLVRSQVDINIDDWKSVDKAKKYNLG